MTDPWEPSQDSRVKVTATDHFPWLRTRLADDCAPIMAWLPTAVSLIGFGFAIVQFFERMRQRSKSHLGSHIYNPGLLYWREDVVHAIHWIVDWGEEEGRGLPRTGQ